MNKQNLLDTLTRIDGRGYPAYKDIRGSYHMGSYILHIDHVQSDPFAAPSPYTHRNAPIKSRIPGGAVRYPGLHTGPYRTISHGRYTGASTAAPREPGAAARAVLSRVQSVGQEILERTSVVIDQNKVEARLTIGLPAAGRRVLGRQAIGMFDGELPQIAEGALCIKNLNQKAIQDQADLM